MSDVNEKKQQKMPTGTGGHGMVNKAGLGTCSSLKSIDNSAKSMGMSSGQGFRPERHKGSMTRSGTGKTFKIRE